MEYPKLFIKQPKITPNLIADFTRRGLLIRPKTLHKSERRTAEVTNATAGDVVSHKGLVEKLQGSHISPMDARALLAIEATRTKGPRMDTHVPRLLRRALLPEIQAFDSKCAVIKEEIESWAKNQA